MPPQALRYERKRLTRYTWMLNCTTSVQVVSQPNEGNRSDDDSDENSDDDEDDDDRGVDVRSDIHVLIVGDPGLGKSQLLRAAANIANSALRKAFGHARMCTRQHRK